MLIYYREKTNVRKGQKITTVENKYYVLTIANNGRIVSSTKDRKRAFNFTHDQQLFNKVKRFYLDNFSKNGKLLREIDICYEE